ncbi:MAG: hypothetical protein HY709_07335 [Candidatus Latescibacteria bacterium]|nr:hypothetical protein [Candidatus Latescibacterota bacterium]
MKHLKTPYICIVFIVLGLVSCLTPLRSVYHVEMTPIPESDGYRVDPVDDALVFSKEGLQIRVRYMTDELLRSEIPGSDNPYVVQEIDPTLEYRPMPFTVFQVTVVNPTFAKVRLDPEKTVLITDRGRRYKSYAINRVDARGGLRNFETYFLVKGVQTGNTQKLYLERMGKVRETIYHRDSPVFKGNTYTGKIVFEPLPPETKRVELVLDDFILSFGIHDVPTDLLTLRFPFSVKQGVLEPPSEANRDQKLKAGDHQ